MEMLNSVKPFLYLSRALGMFPYKMKRNALRESTFLNRYSKILTGLDSVFFFLFTVNNAYFHSGTFIEGLMSGSHWVTIGINTVMLAFVVSRYRDVLRENFTKLNDFQVLESRVKRRSLRLLRLACLSYAVGAVLHCVVFMLLYSLLTIKREFFFFPALREISYLAMYLALNISYVWCFLFVVCAAATRLCFSVLHGKFLDLSNQSLLRVRGFGRTQLKSMSTAYEMLIDISDDMNSMFSFYFLSIGVLVFLETLYSFTIYVELNVGWLNVTFSAVWLSYYVIQFIAIVVTAVQTSKQAEKTANYLHELFIDNDDPELKEEIEIFSLQLLHRKVEFNACGFFKLDFSLLYSMVGAVTTYIIILMQFQGNNTAPSGNCVAMNCTNCTSTS